MATILTEDRNGPGHYIVSEANGMYRSREQSIIASGSGVLAAGAVLAVVSASGKKVPFAPGATDGSENATSVLFEACDATGNDVRRTTTERDTEVHVDVLKWADGVTDAQKTTALAALEARGIIGR